MADRREPVPHNSRRACLCRDGSYSKKCCGGDYYNQGIGNITGDGNGESGYIGYRVEACADQHTHNVHIHGTTLEVGQVYYLELENNHNACYKILSRRNSEGIHIESASIAYVDCATCTAAN
jgi:hypothetical protein